MKFHQPYTPKCLQQLRQGPGLDWEISSGICMWGWELSYMSHDHKILRSLLVSNWREELELKFKTARVVGSFQVSQCSHVRDLVPGDCAGKGTQVRQ